MAIRVLVAVQAQNEDVVRWLLDTETTAMLMPPFDGRPVPAVHTAIGDDGGYGVRFYPKTSGTSGFFLTKITKKHASSA